MRNKLMITGAVALTAFATTSYAALLAEYNFNDGTADDSAGSFDLADVPGSGGGTIAGGVLTLDGNSSTYYENTAYGAGSPSFTVSLWVNASNSNQGDFKGLFSNADLSTDSFSWQVTNSNGAFAAVSNDLVSITGPTSGDGAPIANRWQNVIVKKVSSSSAQLWVDGTLVGSDNKNFGGLHEFRVGVNRNSNHQYAGQYDKIQVYTSNESVADIFALGRLNQTNSWIAGLGGDSGGDSTWQPIVGSTNVALDSSESLSSTGIASVPNTYSSLAGDGGGTSSSDVFGGSGDASFETLVRINDLAGTHIIYELGGNGSGSSLALIGGELRFTTQTSNSAANRMSVSETLGAGLLGEWLHIVAVITESGAGDDTLELFLNGVSVGTDTIADAAFSSWAGGNAFGFGRTESTFAGTYSPTGNFDGEMALFSHYDYALSRQEVIDQAHHFGIPTPAALPAGLLMIVGLATRRRR